MKEAGPDPLVPAAVVAAIRLAVVGTVLGLAWLPMGIR